MAWRNLIGICLLLLAAVSHSGEEPPVLTDAQIAAAVARGTELRSRTKVAAKLLPSYALMWKVDGVPVGFTRCTIGSAEGARDAAYKMTIENRWVEVRDKATCALTKSVTLIGEDLSIIAADAVTTHDFVNMKGEKTDRSIESRVSLDIKDGAAMIVLSEGDLVPQILRTPLHGLKPMPMDLALMLPLLSGSDGKHTEPICTPGFGFNSNGPHINAIWVTAAEKPGKKLAVAVRQLACKTEKGFAPIAPTERQFQNYSEWTLDTRGDVIGIPPSMDELARAEVIDPAKLDPEMKFDYEAIRAARAKHLKKPEPKK